MPKTSDVLEVASNAYKLVLENDRVRVMELTLRPGDKAPMHNHPNDHVVYIMNDAKFKLDFLDGKSAEFELRKGQAIMMDAGSHQTTNIGASIGRNLVIELKK